MEIHRDAVSVVSLKGRGDHSSGDDWIVKEDTGEIGRRGPEGRPARSKRLTGHWFSCTECAMNGTVSYCACCSGGCGVICKGRTAAAGHNPSSEGRAFARIEPLATGAGGAVVRRSHDRPVSLNAPEEERALRRPGYPARSMVQIAPGRLMRSASTFED